MDKKYRHLAQQVNENLRSAYSLEEQPELPAHMVEMIGRIQEKLARYAVEKSSESDEEQDMRPEE